MDVSCLLLRVSSFCLFKKAVFCWLVLFQHIVAVSRAIPTSQQHPPQSYITYRFWPKKSRSTNKRKTKQNKIQQTKTQQNKIQQANKQTATSYPLPSTIWPVKKKTNRPLPSQPPQLQGNACRALEAIPLDSYHRWWLGFNNPPKSANFLSNEFVIIPNW